MHAPHPRFAGIDGIKGLALIAIILYHFDASVLPGGFVGVDVFLTVSGFLMGTSLVRELGHAGSVDLRGYLWRRARRIVPALVVMVPLAVFLARLLEPDLLVRAWGQVLGGVTLTYNWVAVLSHASYFDAMNPQLFQHLWFVAVLAQCYLVAPLLMRALWGRLPARAGITVLAGLALASFVLMGALLDPAAPTRVYEGTDTHAGGFLLGMALAWWLALPRRGRANDQDGPSDTARPDTPRGIGEGDAHRARGAQAHGLLRRALPSLGFGGLVVLCGLALGLGQGEEAFRGGIASASVCSVLLVLGTIPRGSWMRGLFDMPPLVVLGRASYGVYLWHWPLWLLVSPRMTGMPPVVPMAVTLALTFVTALASRVLVEEPAAHASLPGPRLAREARAAEADDVPGSDDGDDALEPHDAEKPAGARRNGAHHAHAAGPLGVPARAALAALYLGCVVSLATAPATTEVEAKIAQLEGAQADGRAQAADGAQTGADPAGATGSVPETTTAPATTSAATDAALAQIDPANLPNGSDITAIGDSVMLFCKGGLEDEFPGIAVDAKSSRNAAQGLDILQGLAQAGTLRHWVVLGLSSNSFLTQDDLDHARQIVGDDRVLVFVGAHGPASKYPRYPEMNELMRLYAQAHASNTVFVDWDAAISQHPDLLYEDGVHPHEEEGGKVYAQAVAAAMSRWQAARNS